MIRIAIVEDEKKDYVTLLSFIEQFNQENITQCTAEWFPSGTNFVEQYQSNYDLILLDVEMPVLSGIDTAREIRQFDSTVLIMFITNMAQYAIKGFEVDAMDYVLKPISYYDFKLKLNRAIRITHERIGKSILLKFENHYKKIFLKDILYVEVSSHKLEYHTFEGISIASGSLKEVEKKMDSHLFVRCNSCYLVNLMHITGIENDQVMIGNQLLKISRSKKAQFMEALTRYYNGGGR